ncbi:MAG TPA: DUF1080 domain-containing protein [Syntrophobacter fumaroxidans]|nr:DUF1080 domain-containing protein [Syntrophobacter fumaroxidans]
MKRILAIASLGILICAVGFSGVSQSALIVIDGMNFPSTFEFWKPDTYTNYLLESISNGDPNYWRNTINSRDGVIIPFQWSNDTWKTDEEVERLISVLKLASESSINKHKPLVILSHSWGTVLAYLAISRRPGIHIDKLITLGSPLQSNTPIIRQFTDPYISNVEALTNVREWHNYWSIWDIVSGSIDVARNFKIPSVASLKTNQLKANHAKYYKNQKVWDAILLDAILCHSDGFHEGFGSGTAQHWTVNSYWKVIDEKFRASSSSRSTIAMVSTYDDGEYRNFTYQASVKQNAEHPFGYASYIIFRATPDFYPHSTPDSPPNRGTGYAFGINDSNYKYPFRRFYIYKIVNGKQIKIKGWTFSSHIKDTNSWNTLKVVAKDNLFKLYINGHFVYQFTDFSIFNGRVGLLGYTGEPKTTHFFDNISVVVDY